VLDVPAGHAPFALWNRSGNRVVRGLLRSPLHPLLSRQLALITVTGRRSGREYTLPIAYKQDGERLRIPVMWSERKLWWRNLSGDGGAPVRVHLRGEERSGHAKLLGDGRGEVSVEVLLDVCG
jgi:F420H(2)-dependent quinone reductase